MDIPYKPAAFGLAAFNCPICKAYAHFKWSPLYCDNIGQTATALVVGRCSQCNDDTVWWSLNRTNWEMIYPQTITAPRPAADMPEDCVQDFEEARQIVGKSPRGAAALLRLCIQKLCVALGGKGRKIDDDIAALVAKGLPVRVQQALDVVRVVGNNAVHPGEMNLEDDPGVAHAMFGLINMIVENQITQLKQVEELFGKLPEGAREAVAKRDAKAKGTA